MQFNVVIFRENTEFEKMLQTANALGAHIYSPKAVKDLKFIAHNWRLIMDFIAMLPTYKSALEQIAHPLVCNIHIF